MAFVFKWLLGRLQRLCTHASEYVTYDIHEGDSDAPTHWCQVCGAVRIGDRAWREPRADWTIE